MKAPYKLAETYEDDAHALKALGKGEASPEQQKKALAFITTSLSDVDGYHYWPGVDGDRNTAFALGRAMVGQMIRSILISPFTDVAGRKVFKTREREQQ